MSITMPATAEDRRRLEEWVLRRVLSSKRSDAEEKILAALDDPDKDPKRVAKESLGMGGFGGPNMPDVTINMPPGFIVVKTEPTGDEIMRLSMARVVEYVRRKHSLQLTLF